MPATDDGESLELESFEGYQARWRYVLRGCGKRCGGCPHAAVVLEVTMPDGTRRELYCGRPRGSARRRRETREVGD